MDEFNGEGVFWIPSEGEIKKVNGIVKFSQDEGLKLSLMGFLDDTVSPNVQFYSVIHGNVHGKGRVTLFEIYETFRTTNHRLLEGIRTSKSEAIAQYFIIGEHFANKESVQAVSLTLEFEGLDKWIGIKGINTNYDSDGKYLLEYKKPDSYEYNLESQNKKIKFDWSVNYPTEGINNFDWTLSQTSCLIIKNSDDSEMNLFDSLKYVYRTQNLLCLFMKSKTFINKLSLNIKTSLDYPHDIKSADVYYKQSFWKLNVKINDDRNMLLLFNELKMTFDNHLDKWFESYDSMGYIYDIFMGSIYNSNMFMYHTFLTRIQAIEAFHRKNYETTERSEEKFKERLDIIQDALNDNSKIKKWIKGKLKYANEINLKKRIEEVIRDYLDILRPYISDIEKFSTIIMNTRNYYTHFDDAMKDKAIKEDKMMPFVERLEIIMIIILLDQMGIDKNKIRAGITRAFPLIYLKPLIFTQT